MGNKNFSLHLILHHVWDGTIWMYPSVTVFTQMKKKVEANSNHSFSGKCFSDEICNVPYKHTKYSLILIIILTVLLLLILLSTSHKILTCLWSDLRMPYLVRVGIKFPMVLRQKVRAPQDKTHSIIMPVPFPSYVIFSHCYFYL